MNRFEERVVEEVGSRRLFDAGARVICAVSGGTDSVALARSLVATAGSTGIGEIIVAHFDHRVRPGSAADAEWVRGFAGELGLTYYGGSADVPALQKAFGLSPEEAARLLRRDFLLRIKVRAAADAVALGHQMADRAETIFMNLLRGAGVRGLGAMRWRDGAGFVRPLLWTTKPEIVEYLDAIGQPYLNDPTNDDLTYARNFVRHKVFPIIEGNFTGAVRKLAEAAEGFARDDAAVEELARAAERDYVTERAYGVTLDDRFRSDLTPAVAAKLVQLAFDRIIKGRRTLERAHIEGILNLADGLNINLPGGSSAERRGGDTVLCRAPRPVIQEWRVVVSVPGRAVVPAVGYEVIVGETDIPPAGDYSITLDKKAAGGRVIVRSRRPGDRVRPAGLGGTRKIQDIFVDANVPRDARVLHPIITAGADVLAVAGLAVSEYGSPREGRPTVTIAVRRYPGNRVDGPAARVSITHTYEQAGR